MLSSCSHHRESGDLFTVIPAKAGIHVWPGNLDSRFRGNDGPRSRGRSPLKKDAFQVATDLYFVNVTKE